MTCPYHWNYGIKQGRAYTFPSFDWLLAYVVVLELLNPLDQTQPK